MKPSTFQYVAVAATGTQATAGAATATTAIPNANNGAAAKYVRLTSLGSCYVKPGQSGVTATVNDILLVQGESLILDVHGCTHIASLREGGADVKFNITPLEVG